MRYKGRYSIITVRQDEKVVYTVLDNEHIYIRYPCFMTKAEAEEYRAGLYGLTPKQYKEWN